MSAFSIKRTLDLIVFERLLSSESGYSVKPFEQSASDPKRTFGMSKNKSSEVRIPPAPPYSLVSVERLRRESLMS